MDGASVELLAGGRNRGIGRSFFAGLTGRIGNERADTSFRTKVGTHFWLLLRGAIANAICSFFWYPDGHREADHGAGPCDRALLLAPDANLDGLEPPGR